MSNPNTDDAVEKDSGGPMSESSWLTLNVMMRTLRVFLFAVFEERIHDRVSL
jgi:hypothetical protein